MPKPTPTPKPRPRALALALLLATLLPLPGVAAEGAAATRLALPNGAMAHGASPVPVWPGLRAQLFGERPIETGPALALAIEAPERASDGASVPVAIRTRVPATGTGTGTGTGKIRRLWLIVDRNPAPVAAVFRFGPGSGGADIETRLRVEQYSDVRAIAEFDDGHLQMASRHVKASGGCSAPAGRDAAEVEASLGKGRLGVIPPGPSGRPAQAVLRLRHPNASGMARDPLTQLYAPPRYVRRLEVFAGDMAVLDADLDISISEDPQFRFVLADPPGRLRATLTDTDAQVFEILAAEGADAGS